MSIMTGNFNAAQFTEPGEYLPDAPLGVSPDPATVGLV
jgi:hypothetical protein